MDLVDRDPLNLLQLCGAPPVKPGPSLGPNIDQMKTFYCQLL